jgi:hypothetical protein
MILGMILCTGLVPFCMYTFLNRSVELIESMAPSSERSLISGYALYIRKMTAKRSMTKKRRDLRRMLRSSIASMRWFFGGLDIQRYVF